MSVVFDEIVTEFNTPPTNTQDSTDSHEEYPESSPLKVFSDLYREIERMDERKLRLMAD